MQRTLPSVALLVLLGAFAYNQIECKSDNQTDLLEVIKRFDSCVVQSTFSFISPMSYPPKTANDMRNLCKSQQEAFKCIKEKSRGAPSILRRGMLTYVSNRQKHHKKYCTNLDSELSKKFIQDTKCIMEKRFKNYKKIDEDFDLLLIELTKKNYNDPRKELQQFCCIIGRVKQGWIKGVGQECASSSATITELANSVIPNDIEIICEDEDKLAKICPKLEKIEIPAGAVRPKSASSSAAMSLYLVATIGEPRNSTSFT